MKVTHRPSPNFGERRASARPRLVVIHYTAMACTEDALARLCTPEFEVSAHYLVDEAGGILRLVEEEKRAWHAGAGEWAGQQDVNSRSIGIEVANAGDSPFTADQMDALEALLGDVLPRWAIRPSGVIGHSDLAPGRKIDPGTRFDWRRLALNGLSVWPEPGFECEPDAFLFASAAGRFGYPVPGPDAAGEKFDSLLRAFRARFRPWAHGPLDRQDMGAILSLARNHPAKPFNSNGAA